MKKLALILTGTFILSSTGVYAEDPEGSEVTDGITYVDGVFYPTHTVAGMTYNEETKTFERPSTTSETSPNPLPSGQILTAEEVTSTIAGLVSLRTTPEEYKQAIANLNASLGQEGVDNAEIQAALTTELREALVSGANKDADWSQVETLANLGQISDLDFSGTNLTGQQLDTFGWFNAANLSGMNLAGFSFGQKYWWNANLAYATGLSGEDLNGISPAFAWGIRDLSGWNLTGWTPLPGSSAPNLSNSNVTAQQLNAFSGYGGADLSGLNLADFNPTGKTLVGTNLVGTNITAAQINSSSGWGGGGNLAGLNLQGLNAAGQSLWRTNFQGATGLTAEALAAANDMTRPWGDNLNLKGTGITREEMTAALIAQGKDPNSWMFDVNRMDFD